MSSLKGENQAATFVNEFYPGNKLGVFENRRNGFEFYSRQPVHRIDINKWVAGEEQDRVFYVDDQIYPELILKNIRFKILKQFDDHNSENILKFINSTAKDKSPQHGYLIQLQ